MVSGVPEWKRDVFFESRRGTRPDSTIKIWRGRLSPCKNGERAPGATRRFSPETRSAQPPIYIAGGVHEKRFAGGRAQWGSLFARSLLFTLERRPLAHASPGTNHTHAPQAWPARSRATSPRPPHDLPRVPARRGRAAARARAAACRRQRRSCGAPPITPPGAPGPKPSHALHSRRAERRVIRTPWRAADRRGARVRARRRSALSECPSRRASMLSSPPIEPRSLS